MADQAQSQDVEKEKLPLSKAVEFVLDECRMVLPGIQALLGFQLIVVFNPGFDQKLTAFDQRLHLLAIGLIASPWQLSWRFLSDRQGDSRRRAERATGLFAVFATLWFVLPRVQALQRLILGRK